MSLRDSFDGVSALNFLSFLIPFFSRFLRKFRNPSRLYRDTSPTPYTHCHPSPLFLMFLLIVIIFTFQFTPSFASIKISSEYWYKTSRYPSPHRDWSFVYRTFSTSRKSRGLRRTCSDPSYTLSPTPELRRPGRQPFLPHTVATTG